MHNSVQVRDFVLGNSKTICLVYIDVNVNINLLSELQNEMKDQWS